MSNSIILIMSDKVICQFEQCVNNELMISFNHLICLQIIQQYNNMLNEILYQKFSYFFLVFFYHSSIFENIHVNILISYTEIVQHVLNEKIVRLLLLINLINHCV